MNRLPDICRFNLSKVPALKALPGLLLFVPLIFSAPVLPAAGNDSVKVDYRPSIHGALRARYERDLEGSGESRFQVRNARVTIDGFIASPISYFLQADLCDRGKMKILDAWGRIDIAGGVSLQGGQFRMPFGTDCFRAPSNYIFSNRSFIGKQMCNVRAVGAKLAWSHRFAPSRSLLLETGAFNPTSISDHEVWVRELAYAGKASLTFDRVKLASGLQSIEPDSVRVNLWGASATWTPDSHWIVEGEYMNKHYTRQRARTAHAWCLWADYGFPIRAGVFNRASFRARWDGLTPHSDGSRDASGNLSVSHQRRQRITLGAAMGYINGPLHCDLRLDYEKYFYSSATPVPVGDGDRLTAEMVIRF